MNRSNGNAALYRKIAVITLPIVIHNLLDSAVNAADVVMLDFVGQQAMSAVSIASQLSNIFFMFLFGIGSGITMLGAQYWGKGDAVSIRSVQGIALRYVLLLSGVMTCLCLTVPETMLRFYTNDASLIELGASYLRIYAACIAVWGVSIVYLSALRSTGRVGICTALEAGTLLINVALNALFIFVYHMDIKGVAIATVIARCAQLAGCALVSAKSSTIRLEIKPAFERHPALEKDFRSMCVPAIGNDLVWGLAFSSYIAILGRISSDAVAAVTLVNSIRRLSIVLCRSLGLSTSIIVGQILGGGERDKAIYTSHILLRLGIAACAVGAVIIALMTNPVCAAVNLTDQAREYLRFMMHVNVIYIMGSSVNDILIVGVFRAGGDARFGFWCDVIDMWCWSVPLALFTAFVLKLDVRWVYLLMCTDEFVKWPWVLRHFYGKKWARNITRSDINAQA